MYTVTFDKSDLTVQWDGSHDNLLELAEDNGLNLPFGCRSGNCTACQQPVSGTVEYPDGHGGQPEGGNELLCCSIPQCDIVIDA